MYLSTIREELGHINGKKISLVSDLKYGRTVHYIKNKQTECGEIKYIINIVDVLYMKRTQKERFRNEAMYEKDVRGAYFRQMRNELYA